MERDDSQSSYSNFDTESFTVDLDIDEQSESTGHEARAAEIAKVDRRVAIAAYAFIDFISPVMIVVSSLFFSDVVGLLLRIMLTFHLFVINVPRLYSGASISLALALLSEIIIMTTSLVSSVSQDSSRGSVFNSDAVTIAISALAILVHITSHLLLRTARRELVREIRVRVFGDVIAHYLVTTMYYVTLAVMAAANLSFMFLPLLIFFCCANISLSTRGWMPGQKIVRVIVLPYSLFYSFYSFGVACFQTEESGAVTGMQYETIHGIPMVTVTEYSSMVLMILVMVMLIAPPWSSGMSQHVPKILAKVADVLIACVFALVLVLAVAFNSLVSVFWIAIIFWAMFFPFRVVVRLIFPFLSVFFIISFVIIAMSLYHLGDVPEYSGIDHVGWFLQVLGMYRFVNVESTFLFTICGLLMIVCMGQAGRFLRCRDEIVDAMRCVQPLSEGDDDVHVKRNVEKRQSNTRKRVRNCFWVFIYYGMTLASFLLLVSSGFSGGQQSVQLVMLVGMIIVVTGCYRMSSFGLMALSNGIVFILVGYTSAFAIDGYHGGGEFYPHSVLLNAVNGVVLHSNASFVASTWPVVFAYVMYVLLMKYSSVLEGGVPPLLSKVCVFATIISQLVYCVYWDASVFSLAYYIIATIMLISQIHESRIGHTFSAFATDTVVCAELICYLMTHFDSTRNFLASFVPIYVVDLSLMVVTDVKVVYLASTLWFNSMAKIGRAGDGLQWRSPWIDFVLGELVWVFHYFYFYISWTMIFCFAILSDYPTFIKFFLVCFCHLGFAFGPSLRKVKSMVGFIFIMYLVVQFIADMMFRDLGYMSQVFSYVGLYFSEEPNHKKMVVSISVQFAIIFLQILPYNLMKRGADYTEFERLPSTRVYRGLCRFIRHIFPVMFQVGLFMATLWCGTAFGMFTLILLSIVCYDVTRMRRWSGAVRVILNVYVVFQYAIWLGAPNFSGPVGEKWSLASYVPEEYRAYIVVWMEFAGVVNVSGLALISNGFCAILCAIPFSGTDIDIRDNDKSNKELPLWMNGMADMIVRNAYNIFVPLAACCAAKVTSVDGIVLFCMIGLLFIACTLFGFDQRVSLSVMQTYVIGILGMKWLAYAPHWIDSDILTTILDLPFAANKRGQWFCVFTFALVRYCMHLMDSDIYRESHENAVKHMAYRFIREQQLRIIEKLDQDILIAKENAEIGAILNGQELDRPRMHAIEESSEQVLHNDEEKPSGLYDRFVVPLLYATVKLLASTLSINDEAGMNVLTLESCTVLLKRCLSSLTRGRSIQLERREHEFLRNLPPSFYYQLGSLAYIRNFDYVDKSDVHGLLARYILLFARKSSLCLLVIIVTVYAIVSPYVFGLTILLYVVFLFCSIDVQSYPNVYRAFLFITFIILGLRVCAQADGINDEIKILTRSSKYIGGYSVFVLLGLGPDNGIDIEILLYLASIWFVVGRLGSARVFSPFVNYMRCQMEVPDFPDEYTYGIINDPVNTLGLNASMTLSFVNFMKSQFTRKGLRMTIHKSLALAFDILSLILLLLSWNNWQNTITYAGAVESVDRGYYVSSVLILMLTIHIIATSVTFFYQIAERYVALTVVNIVWLLYSWIFYLAHLGAVSDDGLRSLRAYVVIRLLSHMVVAHKCMTGRVFVTFRYPKFGSSVILLTNWLTRAIPFVFELEGILTWMIEPTKVSLQRFMLVRDVAMRLETLIARRYEGKTNISVNRALNTVLWITLCVCMIFIPMLLLSELGVVVSDNPIQLCSLSVGLQEMPFLYYATASIRALERDEVESRSDDSMTTEIVYEPSRDTAYLLRVPFTSLESQLLSSAGEELLEATLQEGKELTVSVIVDMLFERPASKTFTRRITFSASEELSLTATAEYLAVVAGNGSIVNFNLRIPRVIRVFEHSMPIYNTGPVHNFMMEYSATDDLWSFVSDRSSRGNSFDIFVISERVESSSFYSVSSANQVAFGAVYILFVVLVGLVVRGRVMHQLDDLWMNRLEVPERLYKMILVIHLVRNAGDIDKEEELVGDLIDLLRSQAQVLLLTSR